ncbi:STAS domain-containing protein [Exiguobacterium flavidum]|uniref:STAS domain-containing protein n=1 Tax=Exiguobacterium flavidum TaxID=2184695 RepID=UPI000DF7AEF5|nr:STAS domain-containing protein [Exiguobacterium flavidum]
MDLNIRQEQLEGQTHIYVAGEIDTYTAPKLRQELVPAVEAGDVVVHLDEVHYMDSTGLGVFVGALKAAKKNETSFTLIGVSERIRRLFEITGLSSIITIDNGVRGGAQ